MSKKSTYPFQSFYTILVATLSLATFLFAVYSLPSEANPAGSVAKATESRTGSSPANQPKPACADPLEWNPEVNNFIQSRSITEEMKLERKTKGPQSKKAVVGSAFPDHSKVLFVIYVRSGVSLRAAQVLWALDVPNVKIFVPHSNLSFSADEILQGKESVSDVVLFGLSHRKVERDLQARGKKIHSYDPTEYVHMRLNRRSESKSLVQLLEALGVRPTVQDHLIDAYDLGGMPRLLSAIESKIKTRPQRETTLNQILDYDLAGRGRTEDQILAQRQRWAGSSKDPYIVEALGKGRANGFYVFDLREYQGEHAPDPEVIRQEILRLVPLANILVIHWTGFTFTGSSEMADELVELPFHDFYARQPYQLTAKGDPVYRVEFRTNKKPVRIEIYDQHTGNTRTIRTPKYMKSKFPPALVELLEDVLLDISLPPEASSDGEGDGTDSEFQ